MSEQTKSYGAQLSADLAASEQARRTLLEKSGRLTSRARFEALFDEGSYTEIAAFVGGSAAGDADRLLCAYGAVNGECVYAFSQEISEGDAAFTTAGAKKLSALYDLAEKRPAPIVGFFDAAGASLAEGLPMMAALSEVIARRAEYSATAPQIALIAGPCGASLAGFAAGFDLVILEENNGELFVTAPSVVKEACKVEGHAKAALAAKAGQVHLTVKGEEALIAAAKDALSYLPENDEESAPLFETADDANRATVAFDKIPTADAAVEDIFDAASIFELSAAYAPSAKTGFATLAGVPCAFVATDGEALGRNELVKIIRFVKLCDRFELPLITLVNAPAFCACDEGDAGMADLVARLSETYADCDIPMITLITGKAYGPIISQFASKALGADFVYATPSASISLLAPDSAVAFSESDSLKGLDNPIAGRAALIESYLTEKTSPVFAARAGLVDDILAPSEVRARLAFAVNMLTEA
ncbi:MAG: hypothetical protein IJF24_02380 [Clostridia bacterium]|nr:hypothetical protein [Clostridia bacterium]